MAPGVRHMCCVLAARFAVVVGLGVSLSARLESQSPLSFYALTPCRAMDTRTGRSAPIGGPPLEALSVRTVSLAGICGVPGDAGAIAINVTTVRATGAGFLTLYPGDATQPITKSVIFGPGETRPNNAVMGLGPGAALAVYDGQTAGRVDILIDVSGYFRPPDAVAPLLTIDLPPDGAFLRDGTGVGIALSYSDGGSGILTATLAVELDTVAVTGACTIGPASATCPVNETLADGSHGIHASVSDGESNAATATSSFLVDATAPLLELLVPAPGSATPINRPAISATFSDDGSGIASSDVHVSLDGVDATAQAQIGPSSVTLVSQLVLGEGLHSVTISVQDRAGNLSRSETSFAVDTVAPALALTAPIETTVTHNPTPQISLTHSDATSGIDLDSLRIEIDSADITSLCDRSPAGADCVPPSLADGPHTISIFVQDRAGNTATVFKAIQVLLDAEAPAVNLTAPDNGSVVRTQSVEIAGTITDDGTVVSSAVNGAPLTLTGGAFDTTVSLQEGLNRIEIRATDATGKTGSTAVEVTRDTTPPEVVVDLPAEGEVTNQATVRIAGQVTDADSVASLEVNGVAMPHDGGGFAGTVAVPEGISEVAIVATDRAGNAREVARTVNRFVLPVVAISSPMDLSFLAATTVDVAGTVSDASATVFVNGVTAAVANGTYVARDVPLIEGGNELTAVATATNGHMSTATISVVRDLTPPRVTVDWPRDEMILFEDSAVVSGLINDIAAGTVNVENARVTVNGRDAAVSNRSYAVDVPLNNGDNAIMVTAVDSAGNASQRSVTVRRVDPNLARLVSVSGDGQAGVIGTALTEPLTIRAVDAGGQTIAGTTVLFRVRGNDGALEGGSREIAALAASNGEATAHFTLGTHVGVRNQIVEASGVGFGGPVRFAASALPGPAALIVVDSGNEQVGVASQALPRPFVAVVTDHGFNRLPGIPVRFRVTQGEGHFANGQSEMTVETDSDGRAIVSLTLGPEDGTSNNAAVATVEGLEESDDPHAVFVGSGWAAGEPSETAVSGVVLDNSNVPIAGATLRIRGSALTAQTDAQGLFRIAPAPVGTVKLIVDGSTVARPGSWPDLEFVMTTIPGRDNTLGMPIFLLPLDLVHGALIDETHGATLTLAELPGFSLEILPGSVTFPGGSKSGVVSVTPVHSNKVPMTPNFGQQPRLIFTIQPPGARFDPPARMTLPNLEGLNPGQVTEFYSFDHDLGHFVSIGPATVSEDAMTIVSNPGVGILKGGWHCGGNPPPTPPRAAHNCPQCKHYDPGAGTCVNDPDDTPAKQDPTQPCVSFYCKNGSRLRRNNNSAILPQESEHDCYEEVCKDGSSDRRPAPWEEREPQESDNCLLETCQEMFDPDHLTVDRDDHPAGLACCANDVLAAHSVAPVLYSPETQCCLNGIQTTAKGPPLEVEPEECPNRVQATHRQHEFNGCSVPEVVAQSGIFLSLHYSGDPNNPAGGRDTQFSQYGIANGDLTGPCDEHDVCFQTCRSDRSNCNTELFAGMLAVCLGSHESDHFVEECFAWAVIYGTAVSRAGFLPWHQDQEAFCQCC